MDYPISVPSVGLVGGKFVDEDPLAGTPGSLIPAQWGNAVTEEIIHVITAAGLTPDEMNNTQLLAAIKAVVVGAGVTPGRLIAVRVFAASATYIPTAGTKLIIADVQGGGGQGGGSPAGVAGNVSLGTGGHSGAHATAYLPMTGISSIPITVGAGGSSSGPGAAGQNGGSSSVGSYIICPGGSGGGVWGPTPNAGFYTLNAALPLVTISAPAVSIKTGGGNAGAAALILSGTAGISGCGGPSQGYGGNLAAVSVTSAGPGANQFGAGGGGAITVGAGAAQFGGQGGTGRVVIYEYS